MFPGYFWGADWRKYKTPVLRTGVLIGYMQSGKTTLARWLAYKMHQSLTAKRGVDDSEIAYVETPSLRIANTEIPTILGLDKTRYLMIFVDDAVKHAHSRQHNIEETKLYTDIRHWAMQRGVLIVLYATQDFRLLDRLMRNSLVFMWKTLPPEWWISTDSNTRKMIIKWIGDIDYVDALAALTRDIYSNDPKRSLAALEKVVVRIPTQGYGPVGFRGITPVSPPESIYYRLEEGEGEKEEDNSIDPGALLHALNRLLNHLAGEGYRYKWNRDNYLIVKTPAGKELSLGPLGEIEEIRRIVETIRENNYIPV